MARSLRSPDQPEATWSDEDLGLALRRLELAARFALLALLLATLAVPFAQPNVEGIRAGTSRPYALIPLGFGITAAFLFVLRRPWTARARLDAGFAFLFAASFCTSLFVHWLPYASTDVVRGFSPAALLGLVFALLVPAPPRRLAAALVVSALLDPLALVVTLARGNPSPPPVLWLWLFLPTAGAAGVAILAGRLLHQLGRKLADARALGSYVLLEQLGHGGMGEVWRAEHATLARPAAIKLIRPDRLSARDGAEGERLRRRFEREARAAASLCSPHTIEVFDFGVAEGDVFYLVMELLDGLDLAALVARDGPLPPGRVVAILRQACHSLQEAHEAGIVHRDIKPANLFLCRRGLDLDVIKVLDFGLVKHLDDPEATALTADNVVSGTPAFIAPEQVSGGAVDRRTDLYSLGCTAFLLLTGRLPFEAEGGMAMMFAHVNEPPAPPSSVVPGVPASLDEAVLWCLQKDPDARPASAAAWAEALAAADVPPWTESQAKAWWASYRSQGGAPSDPDSQLTELASTLDLGPGEP